jgi:hypothetical protein
MYDDLLVFMGEHVLLAPMFDPRGAAADGGAEFLEYISFELDCETERLSVLPFGEPLGADFSFRIDNPGRNDINRMLKSSYCFGFFEEVPVRGRQVLYVDAAVSQEADGLFTQSATALAEFYAGIFDGGLDIPFVLLRNNEDGSMILGGVGAGSAAISKTPNSAEDQRTIARTFFYAFFDSKITAMNIKTIPNIWIYRGLCDYYADASISALPEQIVRMFAISSDNPVYFQYLRYLYFSLSDPDFLALNPNLEGQKTAAHTEYYFSTQVPLIIDVINFYAWNNTGNSDAFIKELVAADKEAGNNGRPIDVEQVIQNILGEDKKTVELYISGGALIPNFRQISLDVMIEPEDILNEINRYVWLFSYLFEQEDIFYPFMPVFLLNPGEFRSHAAVANVSYNTPEIESLVREFSTMLDQLLLQHAYRGMLAGIDDITTPNIRGVLYEAQAMQKWQQFCRSIGRWLPAELPDDSP